MAWIDVFIRRPVLTWMVTLSLVVFGVLGFVRLGVDQYPKMEFPTVNVTDVFFLINYLFAAGPPPV